MSMRLIWSRTSRTSRSSSSSSSALFTTIVWGHSVVVSSGFVVPNTTNNNLTRNMASTKATPSTTTETTSLSTEAFLDQLNFSNTWIAQLNPETASNLELSRSREGLDESDTNQTKRPVFNGHYVLVPTTGLPAPRLILYSKSVLEDMLGLPESITDSNPFLQYVSGNLHHKTKLTTWATPYALSIMGTRYTNNCPYGTGHGYGDGRAISIGETSFAHVELQLKGGGKTPFHRGADGRAVLRSSVREFLASEAMHHLGVSTTRALSLVVSDTLKLHRPWYRDDNSFLQTQPLPTMDDPRLSQYSDTDKRRILNQLRRQKSDPNVMIAERAAITTRASTSFLRIGHLDLFARRVEQQNLQYYDTSTREWQELEAIIWHACFREYKETAYDPFFEKKNIESAATVLLQESANTIATMVCNWIRVGFCQGNFNADNCLVGGRTMDYGPFGFMDEYDPLFAKWTGSGAHFGFLNQMAAGLANYGVLVESVAPVIAVSRGVNNNPQPIVDEFMDQAQSIFELKLAETFRVKLGFEKDSDVADDLWHVLEPLMRESRIDYTVLFRELSYAVRSDAFAQCDGQALYNRLVTSDHSPFYANLAQDLEQQWIAFLDAWSTALSQTDRSAPDVATSMLQVNPKFVLREWMLVEAYQAAERDEYASLYELYNLIQHPYAEGSDEEIKKYYGRAPDETLQKGGTAFMS